MVHSVKLRGKSWLWKNLLTIKDIIMDNVICLVGNRNDTSVWYDKWSNMGHLFKSITHRDLYDARLKDDMTLKEMVSNGELMWPEECAFPNNLSLYGLLFKTESLLWISLVNWEIMKEVWTKVKELAGFNFNGFDLMDIIYSMIDAGIGNNIRSIVRRISFSASIYNIWIKRNGRIFRDVKRSYEDVINKIVDTVKHKIIRLTVKDSPAVRDTKKIWAVSCKKYRAVGKCNQEAMVLVNSEQPLKDIVERLDVLVVNVNKNEIDDETRPRDRDAHGNLNFRPVAAINNRWEPAYGATRKRKKYGTLTLVNNLIQRVQIEEEGIA
nr:hypothetical protein [Tanacetum cinerariifolium]